MQGLRTVAYLPATRDDGVQRFAHNLPHDTPKPSGFPIRCVSEASYIFGFDHPAGTIGEYGDGLHFVALSPRAPLLFARLPIAPRGHPRLSALSKIAGLLWPSPTHQGFAAPTSTSP